MKRVLFILCLTLMAVCSMQAKLVSETDARQVANNFFSQNATRFMAPSVTSPMRLAYKAESNRFYVYDRGARGGYVIIAGDDRLPQVLGYGDAGDFSANTLPPAVQYWLDEMNRQIAYLLSNEDALVHRPAKRAAPVSPLVTTQWNQGEPYNNYCPTYTLSNGNAVHSAAGCVATATAQMMKYYDWPAVGRGSHSYTCNVNSSTPTQLSADFSQSTYRWDLMLDVYDSNSSEESCDAVARLMSDVGISMDMGYGESSGASEYAASEALHRYFDYTAKCYWLNRDYFDADEWDQFLVDEISLSRPVMYCGYAYDGGHAFILDGFNADGYFHVNWGWGGAYDGYFMVSLLAPTNTMDFKYMQDGLFGLVPEPQTDMVQEVLYVRSRLTPVTTEAPLGQEITVDTEDFLVQGNKATGEYVNNDGETYYYADIPLSLSVFDNNGVERQRQRFVQREYLGQGWYSSGWSITMDLPNSLEEGEYKIKLFYSLDGGINYDQEVRHHSGKELYVKMTVRNDTAYLSDCFLSDLYTVTAFNLPSGILVDRPFNVDVALSYRTWWSSGLGPLGHVYLSLLNDDKQEISTSELCEVQIPGNNTITYQMQLTAPAEWGRYHLALNDEGGSPMMMTPEGWSWENDEAVQTFIVLPVCEQLVEDFESMRANNSTSDKNVQGNFVTWSFNKSGVRAPGEGKCFGDHSVMMKLPSAITTSQPLSHNFFMAQATFFNPTSTLSKYRLDYSLDGGANWVTAITIDNLEAAEVPEKSQALATWFLNLTADQPALLRIAMIGGGSGSTYVDDIVLYYSDNMPGDVNGDGEINIADVNCVINVILTDVENAAADVNDDGEVNIADVNAIIDIIMNS